MCFHSVRQPVACHVNKVRIRLCKSSGQKNPTLTPSQAFILGQNTKTPVSRFNPTILYSQFPPASERSPVRQDVVTAFPHLYSTQDFMLSGV